MRLQGLNKLIWGCEMISESSFFKSLVKIFVLACFVVVAIVYAFQSEVAEAFNDSFTMNQFAVKRPLKDQDLAAIKGYELRSERNDSQLIRVSSLRPGPRSAAGISLSFVMTNEGENNDFPSVRVYLVNGDGKTVREAVFSAADYSHGEKFEQQDVNLTLILRPGETGFTVKPFYEVAR